MSKRSSTGLVFVLLTGPAVAFAGAVACGTDNGDTTHGPDIGPLPILDGGRRRLPDGAIVEADGAPVEDDDADTVPPDDSSMPVACTGGGTAAILAGTDTALSGAVRVEGGAWQGVAIAGGAAKSKPAIVAFGAGFLGVTRGADKVQSVTATGAAWSAPADIGVTGVSGPPSLAVVGTKVNLVYSANTFFKHGIYDGTAWNAAEAPVGTGSGTGMFSFGTNSAGLGAVGNEVVFAENGGDNGLYARTFGTAWSGPLGTPIHGAGTLGANTPATPEVAPIAAGKSDLVIVYACNGVPECPAKRVGYATRQPAETTDEKKWGNPLPLTVSDVQTLQKFNVAAISPTAVVLTVRGEDGNGYYSIGTASGDAITWSAAAPVGGTATAVDAAPAVAKGICGDEAIFAFASGGVVKSTSLKGGTFSATVDVAGASGANVAIATK